MNMSFQNVSNQELLALIANTPNLQLIDVRTPNEYSQLGHVAGSINLPVQTIDQWFTTLDATKPTALLCQGGVRSVYACDFLATKGFTTLYNLTNGMKVWEDELCFNTQASPTL